MWQFSSAHREIVYIRDDNGSVTSAYTQDRKAITVYKPNV